MHSSHVFIENSLRIEQDENDSEVRLTWTGRSTEREPARFLTPILDGALQRSRAEARPLVLDFRSIEYMNSSTFTPLVVALEQARSEGGNVRLLFRSNLKWQNLSFSALRIFETLDKRIELCGVDG
ncbi:MAG: hypothetical protein HY904_22280 [Deltaproteobacteria bacterium]|nr:hypothetical protein [Deltaproteobacteria bacterium]